MLDFFLFPNWDLLILGLVVIASVVLGSMVYFEKSNSATHKSFFFFAILTAIWGILNYLSYQISNADVAFAVLRITIFTVTWKTYYFLKFSAVFPNENPRAIQNLFWKILQIFIVIVSGLTLTPYILREITTINTNGTIGTIANGPLFPIFGMTSVGLTAVGVFLLLRKTLFHKNKHNRSYILISIGAILMFALIITFNFVFPALLDQSKYVRLGALFIFPFIALTSYAIIKKKIFNVRVLSAELFITALLTLSLLQLIQANGLSQIILRGGIFISLLGVGVLLIKSVRREVEQREKLESMTQELASANIKLEELNQQKSEFLSFASHDLKSPIALIKQFASLLYDGTYSSEEQVHNTALKIKTTAARAITLVENFLNLRKIEEGKIEYNFEDKNLVSFVKEITENFKLIAAQKKIAVSFSSQVRDIPVSIDVDKMSQVFQNLLDNSLKYTETGSIAVSVTEEQSTALVSIKDTGIGMKPEILPTLFEQFHRDPKVTKKIKGTGLGLYISKQAVLGHHGEIWVESPGEGQGSTFFVRLKKKI